MEDGGDEPRIAFSLAKDCFCFNFRDAARWWRRRIIGYASGALFGVAWWVFIDAAVSSAVYGKPVPVVFEDYLPPIMNSIALVMINCVDKSLLTGEADTYGSTAITWRARLFAFLGVAISVGSLGGAISIFSVKYLNQGVVGDDAWFGLALVIQNFLILFSAMLLWLGHNTDSDGSFSIRL